jgi:transposase InsO family protein
MNSLYRVIEISKQSLHQRLTRQLGVEQLSEQLLTRIREVRQDNPKMSSRMMYNLILPQHVGRDKFEAFCFEKGFKVEVKRSFHRTTNSLGVTRFDNLASRRKVTGINQIWASDITYYRIREKFYYLTFIMDLHSRFIVGYSVSKDLSTERTTLPALKMAINSRKDLEGLVIHSDGGGQYYCKEWLNLTRLHKMKNSMCENVYENAHAERLNGIIKNDYLIPYGVDDYNALVTKTKKVIRVYNYQRPHQSIGKISPSQFEGRLKTIKGGLCG